MNDFGAGHIIFLLVFLYFVVRPLVSGYLKGSQQDKPTPTPTPTPTTVWENTSHTLSTTEYHWPALGNYDFDVVGESHYQEAISRIADNHETESENTECTAELVPEDSNQHDSKAIAVRISGNIVGYLSREDARSFRRRLAQKKLSGTKTTCNALIVGGGTKYDGEKLYYGVKLDIKPFD